MHVAPHISQLRLTRATILAGYNREQDVELLASIAAIDQAIDFLRVHECSQPNINSAQPCGCDAGANWTCEQHRDSAR
jgi:hypothetical protein